MIAPIPSTDGEPAAAASLVGEIWHSGTHGSYVELIEGRADLVLVARVPSADELAAAEAALDELRTLVDNSRRVNGKLSQATIRKSEKLLDQA